MKKDNSNSNGELSREDEKRLAGLRQDIDRVDTLMLDILNRRANLSLEVGKLKAKRHAPIFRPAREAEIMEGLVKESKGPLPEEHLRAIYREIFSSSRAMQKPASVAYLGPEGTFSNIASQEFFGHSHEFLPMGHLSEVFDAVQKRECDYGAIPIENSLNGTVGQSLDLFSDHEVYVQAEWFSRINLSLLSLEENFDKIKAVYSHPQPLGQCAGWLRKNLPAARQVSLESTAASAQRAAQEPGSAAIGDARLSAKLGLNLLAQNIEDMPDNWTRFFVIGSAPAKEPDGADKSSIMFSLPDKPGSLSRVLATLSEAGINMSKLESRPMRGERWKYIFFADLDCDINSPEHAPAFARTAAHCLSARVLGSYPAGRHIYVPK